MTRPTKYTPARVKAILTAVELGASYEHAAAAAGVHRDTLTEWRKRYPAFSDALTRAGARGVLACFGQLHSAAEQDWRAAAWILEHRFPEQYGRQGRLQVQHSGSVGIGVEVSAVVGMLARFPDARDAVVAE